MFSLKILNISDVEAFVDTQSAKVMGIEGYVLQLGGMD